jgi:UDP-3-O-acyl N-acetylglucosamine deacetylase
MLTPRLQRTLAKPAECRGIGFLTGADVQVTFLPAPENSGIVFQRVDLPERPTIPATLEYVQPRARRTAIASEGAVVELIEHAMASLAGLQIDNCVVQLNAPELPGGDGSSLLFVHAILEAGIVEQLATKPLLVVSRECQAVDSTGSSQILAGPVPRHLLAITFELDYGPRSPIRPQGLTVEFSPELFVTGLAFARTFILEEDVTALRSAGYGTRVTEQDLLIFGPDGVIGNELRARDECVRHKILDCIGDFALLGCDLHGHFRAYRSGHSLNHAICRAVREAHEEQGTFRQVA